MKSARNTRKRKPHIIWVSGAAALILALAAPGAYGQNFAGMVEVPTPAAEPDMPVAPTEPAFETHMLGYPLQDDSTYTLGVTDVIEISVMRHPEVSGEYIINKEGKIQYEFVGDIPVVGLTKDQVKERLYSALSEYIIDPDITVKIIGYNSKVVFVIGEVGRPGKIFMQGDTITVHEALVQAGLPLLSASTRKCRLITPASDGKAGTQYVNVFTLLYEGDLRENLVMKPGDTLYIPATIMSKAMRVISPVTQPITAAGAAARPIATGGF